MKGRLLPALSWQIAERVSGLLVGLAITSIIARHYGPDGARVFGYAAAVFNVVGALSIVCGAAAILPRLSRRSVIAGRIFGNVFIVRQVGAVIVVAASIGWLSIVVHERELLYACAVMVLAIAFLEPANLVQVLMQAAHRNAAISVVRMVSLAVRLAVVVAMALALVPVWLIGAGWVIESVMFFCLAWALVAKTIDLRGALASLSKARVSIYASYGLAFLPAIVGHHVFVRVDRLVLINAVSADEFGIYAAAMQFIEAWFSVPSLLSNAAGPAFLFAYLRRAKNTRDVLYVSATFACLALAAAALSVWLAEPFVQSLLGPRFSGSANYLIGGMAVAVLYFADQALVVWLGVLGKVFTLAGKYAISALVAWLCVSSLASVLGAWSGLVGLGLGLVAGWIWVALTLKLSGKDAPPNGHDRVNVVGSDADSNSFR